MKWAEKPYHSLDYELKKRFGEKVYRLALNGGMTCPNRDGKVGHGGCIFCSSGGSGDFAGDAAISITDQIQSQKTLIRQKRPVNKFIAYFQAYTNTYAPTDYLEKIYQEAIADPDVVALSIATRPDCLPEEVIALLSRLNQMKPVWIELGLQTIHENTARFIRRGYELSCFEQACQNLQREGIEIIVHTILGLPHETPEDVLATIDYLNTCHIHGIKLQLLHVLKETDLAAYYEDPGFKVMGMDEYITLLISCIEHLDPDIVIHRITGDGPADLLIAPLWSQNKRSVLNKIHATFRERDTWQGKYYKEY